jgi:hypothetical protein
MRTLSNPEGLLTLGSLFFFVLLSGGVAMAVTYDDPEDSPLYASSVKKVFADMAARDGAPPAGQPSGGAGLKPGTVIVVEGAHWSAVGSNPKDLGPVKPPPAPRDGGNGGHAPLDVTTDLTCSYTCAVSCSTPCGPTWDTGATCHGAATCHVPGPTCIFATCDGTSATCSGSQPTCFGVSCNQPGQTCTPCITFIGPSCNSTCSASTCPTTLSNVTVPRAGQIQMSFWSSSLLTYTLQYCTNLSGGQWTDVSTVRGSDNTTTISHTNSDSRSFYRLLVQP